MAAGSGKNLSDDTGNLSASAAWKGENESDAELMETYESPLA